MQLFKEQAIETLQSTACAKSKSGDKVNISSINSLGEIRLVMLNERAYSKWAQIFKKYQDLELTDPDSKRMLKDMVDDKDRPYKFPYHVISSSFLRPLVGLHDSELELLADHILSEDPKVYLGIKKQQFPRKWTRAQKMATWVTRKKYKVKIIRIIMATVMKNRRSKVTKSIKKGDYAPSYWKLAKKYLSISTFHVDHAIRVAGLTWLKSQVTQGKANLPLSPEAKAVLQRMVDNRTRHSTCMWAADHTFRVYRPTTKELSCHFMWQKGQMFMYTKGPAMFMWAEVGIMDFRTLIPLADDATPALTAETYMNLLNGDFNGDISRVATWMIIYSRRMESVVLECQTKFFPEHSLSSTVGYTPGKGEPEHVQRDEIRIMYLQTSSRIVYSCEDVMYPEDGLLPRKLEEEGDLIPLGASADSVETYRLDHRHHIAKCELRTEVYMAFIDRYCRPSGTVLLYFCGMKALAACAVSTGSQSFIQVCCPAHPIKVSGRSFRNGIVSARPYRE